MDRGAWEAVVHGVAKSWTHLSDSHSLTHSLTHSHALIRLVKICMLTVPAFMSLTCAVLSHSVNCYLKETSKYHGLNKTGIYFCFPDLSQGRRTSAGSVTLHPNARIPFLGSGNASVSIISQPAGTGKGSKEGLHFSSLEKKCQMAILHNKGGGLGNTVFMWSCVQLKRYFYDRNEELMLKSKLLAFWRVCADLRKYVFIGLLSVYAVWSQVDYKIHGCMWSKVIYWWRFRIMVIEEVLMYLCSV